MKESEILRKVIDDIDAVVPSGTPVQTKGGGGDKTPPAVVVSWDATRQGGPVVEFEEQDDGTTDRYYKYYYQMVLDLELTSEDELQSVDLGDSIGRSFMLYESSPSEFHSHTMQWSVGDIRPQSNPVVEPDWYETTCRISFGYMKVRTDTDVPTLNDIQYNITNDL